MREKGANPSSFARGQFSAAGEGFRRLGREVEEANSEKNENKTCSPTPAESYLAGVQQAKGGDPMSHGSARGSVLLVREMKA